MRTGLGLLLDLLFFLEVYFLVFCGVLFDEASVEFFEYLLIVFGYGLCNFDEGDNGCLGAFMLMFPLVEEFFN